MRQALLNAPGEPAHLPGGSNDHADPRAPEQLRGEAAGMRRPWWGCRAGKGLSVQRTGPRPGPNAEAVRRVEASGVCPLRDEQEAGTDPRAPDPFVRQPPPIFLGGQGHGVSPAAKLPSASVLRKAEGDRERDRDGDTACRKGDGGGGTQSQGQERRKREGRGGWRKKTGDRRGRRNERDRSRAREPV